MGYKIEFNWALKLKPNQGLAENNLKEGRRYVFEKEEERVYPINMPIELINDSWEVIGKAKIVEFSVSDSKTNGIYEVVEVFNKAKRKLFTESAKKDRKFLDVV